MGVAEIALLEFRVVHLWRTHCCSFQNLPAVQFYSSTGWFVSAKPIKLHPYRLSYYPYSFHATVIIRVRNYYCSSFAQSLLSVLYSIEVRDRLVNMDYVSL